MGSEYLDMATQVKMRNFLLVYQDTYIFGKGYMDITKVQVPEKFMTIK